MTASNGIRTVNKIKRLAAAVALAVAAVLAAASLSPARADAAGTSDGNLVIDVPTTVPCALMADGTVVSPSEWKITTSGDAYIASASAIGFPANVEWSARTADLASTQAGSVQVSGTSDAATVVGPGDPAAAKLAPSAGFEWAFSKLDAEKNSDIIAKAAGGTAVLGSVTFTFAKVEPDAFAVYSADDNSLSFYKRAGVPVTGQTFEGKTATEVYTGIETMTSIPGWTQNHFNDIKTVMVYDKGIAPTGTAFWFAGVRNLKTADVSKLDMSRCKTIECMFTDCISLETLDLSSWDTSSLTNMSQAFQHCASLTKLNVSGWDVSKVTNMQLAFAEDKALGSLDLSTWDNSATTSMKDAFLQMDSLNEISLGSKFRFVGTNGYLPTPSSAYIVGADGNWYDTDGNGYAPADIPSSKAMTYTAVAPKKAFAVYSSDDDSLSFYKRSSVPAVGDAFEGKTATEVYEGVEKASYNATDGAPWSGHAADIASVTVADEGVAPVSTAYWLKGASKLKSVNLTGLDTSQTTCMDGMFDGCSSLESLDLSSMSTRRVASMSAFLGGCDSLAELSLGSEFAWVGDDCFPPTGDWKQGSTGAKYAENEIPANKTDKYTRAKTAFAVYSADDQSLTFYKRFEAPKQGESYLGKTATSVYEGIECDGFAPKWTTEHGSDLESVTVADEAIAPKSTASWFKGQHSLRSADVSKLDMSKCKDVSYMFWECNSLESIDMSAWDTSSFENISFMLESCRALKEINVSGWDVSNVVNMEGAFYLCVNIRTLDLSSWDNSKTENMKRTFWYMNYLEKVRLGGNFKWVGDDPYLPIPNDDFIPTTDCKWHAQSDGRSYSPTEIPEGKADTYVVTPLKTAFAVYSADDQSLTFYKRPELPAEGAQFLGKTATKVFTGFEAEKYVADRSVPWSDYIIGIKTVTVMDEDISPFSTGYWFCGASKLSTVNLAKLDTSQTAFMISMFEGCSALTSLDLSSFNTANVTVLESAFRGCSALTSLDLSSFDVRSARSFAFMFDGCSSLTSLDLSSFDTRSTEDLGSMFRGCSALASLNVSSFDTGNVTDMNYLFQGCDSLKRISLGAGFKWSGSYCYPRAGNWKSSSTGMIYTEKKIPSGVADTYVFKPNTKVSTAVNAASDPANNDATIAAMTSTGNTQGESAIQEATEGKPPHEAKTSKESGMTTEPDGVEKDAEAKPAVEDEATKEDVSATEPEGVEKADVKKSGE